MAKTQLNIVAGKIQPKVEDQSLKMIFKLVKVDQKDGMIVFECNSALRSIESYFAFLNMWSVIKDERAEASHSLYYDSDTAIQ